MVDTLGIQDMPLSGFHTPEKVLLELHDDDKNACDVIVEMDDGTVYTALFVTFNYLENQMNLHYAVTQSIGDTPAVRYTVIDTPHVMVDDLERDTIEDVIDNLIAIDTFESHFTRVTQHAQPTDETTPTRTSNGGRRATQEVAAVVISDVLVIKD